MQHEPRRNLAEATRNIAAGLSLNWGENWDAKMREEVTGHLIKIARVLENDAAALEKE